MPEYINPNSHTVYLTGPDGRRISVEAQGRRVLPEYFERYCARGYIRRIMPVTAQPPQHQQQPPQSRPNIRAREIPVQRTKSVIASRKLLTSNIVTKQQQPPQLPKTKQVVQRQDRRTKRIEALIRNNDRKKIVGKAASVDATKLLQSNLGNGYYPISNNIGVGILSYNRPDSLNRLIESIVKYTDLRRTTIFISDDASTDPVTIEYLNKLKSLNQFVVLTNDTRLGVAGNSNRLLRCLARFKYGLLLNDDVEVTKKGWDTFYPDIMARTTLHHLCRQQTGVYGALPGQEILMGGAKLNKVMERPHGAVMAFTHAAFEKVGFFDEQFGYYGMEHVDWSKRVSISGLQPPGFYDADSSEKFFTVFADDSVVEDRANLLGAAKRVFEAIDGTRTYVAASEKSVVPAVTYVVPCRDHNRSASIPTVINNIRAQLYPSIQIILVEHDSEARLAPERFQPYESYLVQCGPGYPFNKSKAFNAGAAAAKAPYLIMHDADMLAKANYTSDVVKILSAHDACHIGNAVMYLNQDSTKIVNETGVVAEGLNCERTVSYFEGGSLACKTQIYWLVGGFNENFWGYGVEDCEFYERISAYSRWQEARTHDFLHLWHDRAPGWSECHERNKTYGLQLRDKPARKRLEDQREHLCSAGFNSQLQEAITWRSRNP